VRLTAHQFRHLAGFLYLKANPGGHEVVRRLLGHRSIETTIRFYAGMEVAEAIRHYDCHIAKRRMQTVPPIKRRMSTRGGHGEAA
jgi:integrase